MSSSDISSLSSAESIETDEEILSNPVRGGSLEQYFKKNAKASDSPPPKRKRPASPPHEYVLADNPDIAFVVMFRARFNGAFPKSLPQYGPQDIERGVVDAPPDEGVEKLLCSLIGLVLNRKKDVERGHYTRALEEAIQSHAHQWPKEWEGKNPLHGGGNFNNMNPQQRLTLLKNLALWALNSSDAVQAIIKESYKQQRHEDDLNQPLSVQAWGRDGDKRRYWLIEGQDDTHFRLYRESNPLLKTNTWWSVADSIPSIKAIADKLEEDGSQAARRLRERILAAIPRFEAGEEKRKRRDYRLARKEQFRRPLDGFSLYEGRTRGKRIKYTFSDEEDYGSDALSAKYSNRQSGISTPAEPAGPTFTASGRQVKSRVGGKYGEIMHSGQQHNHPQLDGGSDAPEGTEQAPDGETSFHSGNGEKQANTNGRAARAHIEGYNALDEMDDESEAASSENEWDGGDEDDDVDDNIPNGDDDDDDADMSEADSGNEAEDDTGHKSLVVSLRYPPAKKSEPDNPTPRSDEKPPAANGTSGGSLQIKASVEAPMSGVDTPMTNGDGPDKPLLVVNGSGSSSTKAVDNKSNNNSGAGAGASAFEFASGALPEPHPVQKIEIPALLPPQPPLANAAADTPMGMGA